MNRLDQTFAKLAENDSKGLFPFLVAGQGGMSATIDVIRKFQELGASGIELGFPFSDPIADGPVIQDAFTRALQSGINTEAILDMRAKELSDDYVKTLKRATFDALGAGPGPVE